MAVLIFTKHYTLFSLNEVEKRENYKEILNDEIFYFN